MGGKNNTQGAFFALLSAGLWEHCVQLAQFCPINYDILYQIADDQAVVGLIASGLEFVNDQKIEKAEVLPFLKKVISLERRNLLMNAFIELLITQLREAGVYTILVKGQGIAQCYERPLWRSSGDIDLFFDTENYERAKKILIKESEFIGTENAFYKHLDMTIHSWTVEIHGKLRSGLSARIDRNIDIIQNDIFTNRHIRTWKNGNTDIYLPSPNNDIIVVFTHFIIHFYKGGIGFRQICDWCRLLWTYRESIDRPLLEKRLHKMWLLTQWKAFASLAVNYLGMPVSAMPLYSNSGRWSRKACRICSFILEVGNFGQKRDLSYYSRYPFWVRKTISFVRRCGDLVRHATVFPLDSLRFFPSIVFNGIKSAVRGE